MNFIITSPHHPFVNYAFGYQSIACSPQTKLQNHRLGFFMYALGNQSFFLNKCHLYIHWICGGGGGWGAQNVFSCLQINSSFIEMHLVPASNNNYSTLTESILTLMIFFFSLSLRHLRQKMTLHLGKLSTKQCLVLLSVSSRIYRRTPDTSVLLLCLTVSVTITLCWI